MDEQSAPVPLEGLRDQEDRRRQDAYAEEARREGRAVIEQAVLAPAAGLHPGKVARIGLRLRWACWVDAVLAGLTVAGHGEVRTTGMVMGEEGPVAAGEQAPELLEVRALVPAVAGARPSEVERRFAGLLAAGEKPESITDLWLSYGGETLYWLPDPAHDGGRAPEEGAQAAGSC